MNSQYTRLAAAITAVLGLTTSGALLAAEQFPTTRDTPTTCDSVRWHKYMVAQFPKVVAACREVVIAKDGSKWARFESELEQIESDGTLNFGVQDSRGNRVDQLSLTPDVGQVAYIDGRATEFKDLRRGQVLNLYMPEGGYAFSTQAGVEPTKLVSVRYPVASAQKDMQLASVQFALDSSVLTWEARQLLDSHARSLKDNPTANIRIIGHTSASATEAYNQRLSGRRANAVMDYLVSIPGVNASHLTMVGYGEMRPIAHENPAASVNSKESRANMRVAFEVAAR